MWGRKRFAGGNEKVPNFHPLHAFNHSLGSISIQCRLREGGWGAFSRFGNDEKSDGDHANRCFHEQQVHNARDAGRHFHDMLRKMPTGSPCTESLNSLLRVYTNARWVKPAMQCLAKYQHFGVPLDMGTYSALIEMYCNVREVDRAIDLLRNAELRGLAVSGKGNLLYTRALRIISNALLRDHRGGECLHLLRASKRVHVRHIFDGSKGSF